MMSGIPIQPVILSGGAGTRLWPLSRALYPKQFQHLIGDRTLLQATALRVCGEGFAKPVVVCNEDHRFIVAEQCNAAAVEPGDIILEQAGKDTAPAITVAALWMQEHDPDGLLLVLPSDHVIDNDALFRDQILNLSKDASQGKIVTFGVSPTCADPELGYIKAAKNAVADQGAADEGYAQIVQSFIEKPGTGVAMDLIRDGYSWYSGISLFRPDVFLSEMAAFAPETLALCQQAWDGRQSDLTFTRLAQAPYHAIQASSVDQTIMENSAFTVMSPLATAWQDIRTWQSVRDSSPQDADGNTVSGDVIALNSHNSVVHTEHHLTALLNMDDVCVVASEDAILVSSMRDADNTDEIVAQLDALGSTKHTHHTRIYRPWGNYHSILMQPGFQVKELVINPGAALSLQKHQHRAEHWVVVEGTASVRCGENEMLLHENQSVYIPVGTVHRLANHGKIPLHVIEVQTGSYLGEDDIIRLEDTYGRH